MAVTNSSNPGIQSYLDGFDDGLYDLDKFTAQENNYRDDINSIRMQVLLCILFGRTVIVPEQWAVSSASFLKVADEVIRRYPEFVATPVSRSEERHDRVPPPFRIAYFPRDVGAQDSFAHAMIGRLESDRRIMISRRLDPDYSETSGALRTALATRFREEADRPRGNRFDSFFQQDLEDRLGSLETARRITIVARYLDSKPRTDWRLDDQRYHQALAQLVGTVKHICSSDGREEIGAPDTLAALRELFAKAERDQIDLSEITRLWALARQMGDQAAAIENIGRFCMHRAMAEMSDAATGSVTFLGKSADGSPEFSVIDYMRRAEMQRADPTVRRPGDIEQALLPNSAQYDLRADLPWLDIWENVWRFSVSSDWLAAQQALRKQLHSIPPERLAESEAFNSLFDKLSGRLGDFMFRRQGKASPMFEVILKGTGLTKAGGNAASIGAAGLGATPLAVLTLPIAAFANLVEFGILQIPYKAELKIQRKGRQLARIGKKINDYASVFGTTYPAWYLPQEN